ncbi:MAG: CopG family transcriptional regulator [Clostridium sp.]|nr:CopG family transcriptional regulator [Clostridium celatum]MDU6341143.1 CopG family transcriptional regulator [Clostridium sp.]
MAGERKVRSFSLNTEEDKDILGKLEEVPNISDYIKKLIRDDISNGSGLTVIQREEVKRIVMEILKDKAIEIKEEDIDEKFDPEAVDALEQFC